MEGGLEIGIYNRVFPQSITLTKSSKIVHLLFLSAFLGVLKGSLLILTRSK